MDTTFMNSKSSKISDPHRLILHLSEKINLKRIDKYDVLPNLSIYHTQKNIKKSCKNTKFKISALMWNEKLELPNGLYSVSEIFKIILKISLKKYGKN